MARTILVECAWASLRYNPWAKAIYERVSGKQKTRRKKAAVALARKISVIAWALLRDEKDWEPKRMIEVTESFGRIPTCLKDTLLAMKPKENSDQRKSRLRREAREAREAQAASADQSPVEARKKSVGAKSARKSETKTAVKAAATKQKTPSTRSSRSEAKTISKSKSKSTTGPKKRSVNPTASSIAEKATKPQRARKPATLSAKHAQAAR